MSVARLNYVKHARQPYAKVAKTDDEGRLVTVPVTSKRTGEQKLGRGGRPMTKRVSVSDRSRPLPLLKCGKCGDDIAVGAPYRWFSVGFRSHFKRVRCTKTSCTPRPSEMESSGIRAEIYAAQENFADFIDGLDDQSAEYSEIEDAVHEVGEAFTSAAEQWREADEAFGDGSGGQTENAERADTAESSADELNDWTHSGQDEPDFEDCEDQVHLPISERDDEEDDREQLDRGDVECDECQTIRSNWFNELVDEARDAVDGVEIP